MGSESSISTWLKTFSSGFEMCFLCIILIINGLLSCKQNSDGCSEHFKQDVLKMYNDVIWLLDDEVHMLGGSIQNCYSDNPERYEIQYIAYRQIRRLYDELESKFEHMDSTAISEADAMINQIIKDYLHGIHSDSILDNQFERVIVGFDLTKVRHFPMTSVLFSIKIRNALFLISLDTCTSEKDMHLRSPLLMY